MKSMTGYAYSESSSESSKENITVSAEIKSYNSRFLDVYVHLPTRLSSLESGIREYISTRFIRGKVEVSIKIKDQNAPVVVSVNENAAMAYMKAIGNMAETLGINEKPGLDTILKLEGVLDTETEIDLEKYQAIIESVLADAADKADAERKREGKRTEEDILSHIAVLEKSAGIISSYMPELETQIKENLRIRFAELLGNQIDENRVLAETAVLLMKYTISEELSRLASHLEEFRLETERGAASGKKLDFLSQEINREINTIGSKTPILEVSRAVVEMKNALENIREQLRNVE